MEFATCKFEYDQTFFLLVDMGPQLFAVRQVCTIGHVSYAPISTYELMYAYGSVSAYVSLSANGHASKDGHVFKGI